jgi:uncharacterized phage infection (PIP) family protein YhgE
MENLIILCLLVLLIGLAVIFINTYKTFNKELETTKETLDKMFEFLRDDIVATHSHLKEIKDFQSKITEVLKQHSKRIEKMELEIQQLKSGSNSKFY